jgi:hypothetical protein
MSVTSAEPVRANPNARMSVTSAEPVRANPNARMSVTSAEPVRANPNARMSVTSAEPVRAHANVRESAAPRARVPSPPRASKLAPAPISPEEQELLQKLRAELQACANQTPWAILAISQGADAAQAKAAYFAASKRYHPHLYAHYPTPEIKQVVTELFIVHKRAYTTLLKSGKPSRGARA